MTKISWKITYLKISLKSSRDQWVKLNDTPLRRQWVHSISNALDWSYHTLALNHGFQGQTRELSHGKTRSLSSKWKHLPHTQDGQYSSYTVTNCISPIIETSCMSVHQHGGMPVSLTWPPQSHSRLQTATRAPNSCAVSSRAQSARTTPDYDQKPNT